MELEQYLNPHKRINLMSYPYPFGVIHDFFKPEMYQQLVDAFQLWIPDAEPLGKIGDHDELYYGALCYTPSIQSLLQGPQSLLISKELQNYICQFFSSDKESVANEYVILGAHQHTPPTETSWKHTDFNIVSFAKNKTAAPGYLNAWEPSDCNYTEDTRDALDHLASPAGQAPFGQVADHITLTSSNAMRMLKQACEDLAEQGPLGVSVVDPDLAR